MYSPGATWTATWGGVGVVVLGESLISAALFSSLGRGLGEMPDGGTIQQLGLPVADERGVHGAPPLVLGSGPITEVGAGESTGSSAIKTPLNKPFILSEGLPPVPYKLTARILKGEFVDMAELLRDNLEAQRRAASMAQSPPMSAATPTKHRREIPDLLSWVQCFGTYMAVLTSKFPQHMKELLAYQTLIVREARRCGGKGWLAYDSYFRQQVVGDESADWSRLNQSLYAVTFMAQASRDHGRSCGVCLESDHSEEQCALYSPPTRAALSSKRGGADRGVPEPRDPVSYSRGRGGPRMACFAWNQGDCRFLTCKYRHVYVKSSGEHRISQCPWLRGDRDKPREGKGGGASDRR